MAAPRILPELTPTTTPFWTGGADGALLIEHCDACDRWQHPPTGRCAACGGSVAPRRASGRGTVFTYTVNQHAYHPEVPPPYVIAVVELVEQADLRLPTNIVDCPPEDVRIGMEVQVQFEAQGDVHVPVFAPVPAGAEAAS